MLTTPVVPLVPELLELLDEVELLELLDVEWLDVPDEPLEVLCVPEELLDEDVLCDPEELVLLVPEPVVLPELDEDDEVVTWMPVEPDELEWVATLPDDPLLLELPWAPVPDVIEPPVLLVGGVEPLQPHRREAAEAVSASRRGRIMCEGTPT